MYLYDGWIELGPSTALPVLALHVGQPDVEAEVSFRVSHPLLRQVVELLVLVMPPDGLEN